MPSIHQEIKSVLPPGLNSGDVHEDYELTDQLGQGAFGTAFLAKSRKDGNLYACKTILKRKLRAVEDIEDIRREISILAHLKGHNNVVGFYGAYEDDQAIHIVLEYCAGGELFARITRVHSFSEHDASVLIKAMLECLAFCHEMGVIHRDLKPENFLMQSADDSVLGIKGNDFGLSVFFKPGDAFQEIVGSLYYIAPEVIRSTHAEKADIWSVGVITYIMLVGFPPFWGKSQDQTFMKIIKDPVSFADPAWAPISKQAKDFISKALEKDPLLRAPAAELLKHPWIVSNNIKTPLGDGVMERMRKFASANAFKKRAMMLVAQNLPASEIEGLKRLFVAMDKDSSGSITVDEFRKGLLEKGHRLREEEIKALVENADVDGDGTINYSEFLASTLHASRLEQEEVLLKTFKSLDKDGSGDLDCEEILACMRDCLPQMTLEQAKDLVASVDANNDGRVQYTEFVEMLRKHSEADEDLESPSLGTLSIDDEDVSVPTKRGWRGFFKFFS